MRTNRNSFCLLGAAFALLLTAHGLFAQTEKPVFEEWMVLVLDGKPCGFGSTITTEIDTPGGPQYRTVIVQEFVVKRMDSNLKITETSKVTEDAEGGVLSFSESTSTFGSNMESSGVREGDDLVVSSRGQTQRYHIPRLDALGPEKIRQMSLAVPLKPGQAFTFNTFEAEYPQAIAVEKGTIVDQETRDVRGTERKLWKMTSELSMMPGVSSTMWIDDKGNDVEALTPIPGIGDLHEYVTDRAECMKEPEGVEIFKQSLIRPQIAITSPGEQGLAVYRLTLNDPGKKITLWDQDATQRIITTGPGTCEVQITAPHITANDAQWQLPHEDTPEVHSYLQSTAYLEVNSPEIQALAKKAVGDEKNPVKAAHLIEKFVRAYITQKDLSIAFASAQETAKSHEGDCTEHAVLCAALGRAVGLPTRCVLGLGYIPPGANDPALSNEDGGDTGIFGGHMWAEAWVGPNQWVTMDAAMHGFDVGHIAVTKTALDEINPLVDLQAPLLELMDNLKIEVEKVVAKSDMPQPESTPKPTAQISPASTESPAPIPKTTSSPPDSRHPSVD